jgi:hypothetical protein
MKKTVIGSLFIATLPMTMFAQNFSESFENDSFPDSWIVRSADGCTKGIWSVENYADLADVTNNRITQPDDAGSKLAMSTTGGYSTMSKTCPDSWIISPAFNVTDNAYLKFYYAFNLAYNSNVNLSDDQRAKFAVLVSSTGTDADNFTDEIFLNIGQGLSVWKQVCLDMSRYAGKNIHIAFRNYNTELHASQSSMLTQRLYIDNIIVDNTPTYDLFLNSTSDFSSGIVRTQPLSISVTNFGHSISEFTAGYSINNGTTVSETVNHPLQQGESYEYTFQHAPEFTESGDQTITISATIPNDKFDDNNITSKTLTILPTGTLPFEMNSNNAETDMISSLSGSSRRPAGWTYFPDTYESWIYTEAGAAAYLFTSNCYHLTAGNYMVDISYTSTSATAQFDVYTFTAVGDYGQAIASLALNSNIEEQQSGSTIFQIAEEGDYILGFSISGAAKNEQITLPSLKISEAPSLPDIAVKEILSPKGYINGGNYCVTASFSNNSGVDVTNIPVRYTFNNEESCAIEYIDILKAGEALAYTFNSILSVPNDVAEHQLTVEAMLANDSDTSNNSKATTIHVYTPLQLPWNDSFENDDETAKWTVVNVDNDITYWGITDQYEWDGTTMMLLNSFNSTQHDDWLISPALNFTSTDTQRLAFYYGNQNNSDARANVTVYLTQSTDPEEITSDGIIINSFTDRAAYLKYSSTPFTPTASGCYFIAFHVHGGSEDFYIDDVRVNNDDEIYIASATCAVDESSYEVIDAPITIEVVNGGTHTLNDITVSYTVTDANGTTTNTATEVISAAISAGEQISYTFNNKLNLTTVGTYTISTTVNHSNDTDTRNNSSSTPQFIVLDVKTVPYVAGFEEANDSYAVKLNGKWDISTIGKYAGYNSLYAYGTATDSYNGDWAFLHKLYLNVGTYDFSFFWSTTTGSNSDNYAKNFAIYIGTEPNAESMQQTLFEGTNMLHADIFAKKELTELTVDTDGFYYIGVKNTSTQQSGYIAIDNITVEEQNAGIVVGTGENAYTADFNNREDEWYHYHPSSAIRQWAKATDDNGNTYMTVTESDDWSGTLQTSGFYKAPALYLQADNNYTITVTYSIAPYLSTTTLGNDNSLGLYASTIDNPSNFDKIATFNTTNVTSTEAITFHASETGAHHFALRPTTVDEVTYNLHAFAVEMAPSDGIATVTANQPSSITINGNTITAIGAIEVYNLAGAMVVRANNKVTINAPGIYIVRHGSEIQKLYIK